MTWLTHSSAVSRTEGDNNRLLQMVLSKGILDFNTHLLWTIGLRNSEVGYAKAGSRHNPDG